MSATLSPPPQATDSLKSAARAIRTASIVQGLAWWSALSAGSFLALVVIDSLLHLPSALRLPFAVVWAGFAGWNFYRRIWLPLATPLSAARAARLLETSRGISGNILINAHLFENDENHPAEKFIRSVLQQSRTALSEIPQKSLWWTPTLKKWLGIFLCVAIFWMAAEATFPRSLRAAMTRVMLPLADVPPAGNWALNVTPAGRVTLVEGDPLEVRVQIHSTTQTGKKIPLPVIAWKEGAGTMEPSLNHAEHASMLATDAPDTFIFTFSSVSRAFSFRVWAEETYSAATTITVSTLPRLKSSAFQVTPPVYTGLPPYQQPGPPMALAVPAGSTVQAAFDLAPNPEEVWWREKDDQHSLSKTQGRWISTLLVNAARHYEISASTSKSSMARLLCQGDVTAVSDRPPEVDFVTDDRNRIINPGGKLPVTIHASDDYGVSALSVAIARSDDPTTFRVIKKWTCLGPPGQKEPSAEIYEIPLDPATFVPGSVFLLTAQADDFSPARQHTVSRPILLRVSSVNDLSVPQGDPLEKLFSLLKNVLAEQTRANGLTDNLALHIAEALAAKDLSRHRDGMANAQKKAQSLGVTAQEEAAKRSEAKALSVRIQMLVKGEMDLALGQISKVAELDKSTLAPHLSSLQQRQSYILNELISMLGQIATDRQEAAREKSNPADASSPPPVTAEKLLTDLQSDLKKFIDDQKRIIDASKSLKELRPEDLTTEQEALLGELAREEAKNAAYFQEKLTDLSKVPLQDFADGKVVSEVNEVFQEVQQAAAELYAKKIDLAVPREEAGLENASELEQNLERWLPNTPDNIKWSMEESNQQSDTPMAELPKQLEDIVGELLDKEEEMGDDVEDVSSSFMDSLDKGAGWGAGDGPISNMSARGVTGNQLPNNNEVGGRSGEGRSGKSSGQMVEESAEGKGGRETPTRLNSTPFESGSVNDKAKDSKGGATGGGKLAGQGEEGLRGPTAPPTSQQKMRKLAEQQTKLRQQAEALAVKLRKQRKPTGDLETAINAMKKFEDSAKTQNGVGIFQGYHQALDALSSARNSYRGNRLSRLELNSLNSRSQDLSDTQSENVPAGYEEMTGAYFRSLSESAPSTP